jgi:hypothetical protein
MKTLIKQLYPLSCYFISLRSNLLLGNLFLNTLNQCPTLSVTDQSPHARKVKSKSKAVPLHAIQALVGRGRGQKIQLLLTQDLGTRWG